MKLLFSFGYKGHAKEGFEVGYGGGTRKEKEEKEKSKKESLKFFRVFLLWPHKRENVETVTKEGEVLSLEVKMRRN